MGLNGIIYPSWENAVRLTEDYAALLLVLTVLFALMPVISVTVLTVRAVKTGWRKGKYIMKNNVVRILQKATI